MKLKNKLSFVLIILIILSLIMLNFICFSQPGPDIEYDNKIKPVGQTPYVDLNITKGNFTLSKDTAHAEDEISISTEVLNQGNIQGQFTAWLYLEYNGTRTELENQTGLVLPQNERMTLKFDWQVGSDINPGIYRLVISVRTITIMSYEKNLGNNEANKTIIITSTQDESFLELETNRPYGYPGKKIRITATISNNEPQQITAKVIFYYYPEGDIENLTYFTNITLVAEADSKGFAEFLWDIPEVEFGNYIILAEIAEPDTLKDANIITLKLIEKPDTAKSPVYMELWFIIGLVALIIFFLTIIFSLIGIIPQDRLPIQPALVVMALVIMIIALVGNYLDPSVHLIGAQDIAGMVIIHPITALTAGFLVAGGLEAAGAFTAAADALSRIEKLKFKGKTIFGFTGTVVILTNIPTLIAMPCGRILGAALMPAALFFGYRVAKSTGDARMVGVVVFAFIVNAAASCGPSPLGGIGTIGEGLSKMPIGSFTTAQSTGIMICTGVCALFMRFITPMHPADLSDEDIKREKEAEEKAVTMGSDIKEVSNSDEQKKNEKRT